MRLDTSPADIQPVDFHLDEVTVYVADFIGKRKMVFDVSTVVFT